MKKLLPLIAPVLLAVLLPTTGLAKTTPQNALTLKLGAFFPNSTDARDVGGDTQLVIGLDDKLSVNSGATPSATSVYLDYIGGSKSPTSIHTFGGGVSLESTGQTYFGAGLGIYSTNVSVQVGNGTFSRTSSGGGGKVFIGFELGGNAQLEFDYHLLPSAAGVSASGAAIELGIHL